MEQRPGAGECLPYRPAGEIKPPDVRSAVTVRVSDRGQLVD